MRKLDEGCVPEAFAAWCSVFREESEVLKGRHGGEWTMLGELNLDVFEVTLRGMKRKKSVGAGVFSVALLLEADEVVRRVFFDIMMADVGAKRVADDWRRVLYALLKKPAPNNPNLVGERREIALMAQDMKLLLKMVHRECHDRLTDRLINSQMGWLRGFDEVKDPI